MDEATTTAQRRLRTRMIAPRDVPELVGRKGGLRLRLPAGEVVTVRGSRMPADWDRAGALLVDGADGRSRLVPVTGRSRLDMVI